MREKCTAILLAAGAGRRMGSKIAKQYMQLDGKPVIWYGLQAFEQSALVDDVILAVGEGEVDYARAQIVERYGFAKVCAVIEGGKERYLSVEKALRVIAKGGAAASEGGYVLIQDGARPFLTEKLIQDTCEAAAAWGACCAAVPVKDTIRMADGQGFAAGTPDRTCLWTVQTPQVFEKELILEAYNLLFARAGEEADRMRITDDAMVVEQMLGRPVKLVEASYDNIKLTTPEDMLFADSILTAKKKEK